MALVWEKRSGGNHYQVRCHGASIRLYSNGVFHSQWNERDPLKGSLWELLFLPAFFLPKERIRSVLLLGVGGGALIRLLQRFLNPERVIGVDLDPTHLTVARRYFGVRDAELVCADARSFVADYLADPSSPGFDLVIDDLFGHSGGVPVRAVDADKRWCRQLLQLARGSGGEGADPGLVIANFGSRRELQASAWRSPAVREKLDSSWSAELPGYENCVLAASAGPLVRRQLTASAPPQINPSYASCRLSSQLRVLRC
ncbi:methyltransferase domain-containing protein [Microbulbifer flavimaris]|uniref:Methyltransferase domain-containing protein n=1 Tax=Microbulbifer flavimaris TaxID=1781068 RepID=A0ABX4I560_9GAMM|nr:MULTISPECIES: methyltransferase domain-containing protein [Microbulbifer]KUJ84935.1 histidine kinase [Microbulbifer sp. ZGT114]PCO07037.1 methyltransferase domain-containing protein [Microbulbifer flavimaris]